MDTPQDFAFLNENVALSYNPYQEAEYLIIQTYPLSKELRVIKRTFDYAQAKSWCDLENLAHDYSSFGLRIYHSSKLWTITSVGRPGCISEEQDWKIQSSYLEARYNRDADGEVVAYNDGEVICGEIVVCWCSYPYFSALVASTNRNNEPDEYWQPITCLIEDNGRDIDACPNCGCSLIEEDDDDLDIPLACQGCGNYHGEVYGENLLVCAMHPYGWEDGACPDYMNG
jgi:hypothetical protein